MYEAIGITKDLASAGVFFGIALAVLVWIAAVLARFGFDLRRVRRGA